MLKIPLSDFTPGFPGEMHVSVSFNGEYGKGTAHANHVEEYISWTSVPVLEGGELTAKIESLWDDAKSELDVREFEIETEFWGDPFVMELQSYGCSYAAGEWGNSESEMLRVDFDVTAIGEGVSEIYVPDSFLDIGTGALVEQDGFYGNTQMSLRSGATVTESLFFDVGDCRVIDSAEFLIQDENGQFLIELELFDPASKIVSDVESQVTATPEALSTTSAPTVATALPVPSSIPTPTPTATSTSTALPTPTSTALTTPTSTALPTPTAQATPTQFAFPTYTPVPTAIPIVFNTTPPSVNKARSAISTNDLIWQGSDPVNVNVGNVDRDFTLKATIISPHDNGRGNWTWGAGLNVGGQIQVIYLNSNGNISISNPYSGDVKLMRYQFTVNATQNSENDIQFRAWNGVVSVYVNEELAAEIEGMWDVPGVLSVGTNYQGSEIAQGFVMISKSISAVSSSPIRDQSLDFEVVSQTENYEVISTDQYHEVSARFEDPMNAPELLDHGLRIGLPNSNRHFNIKQSTNLDGDHVVHMTVTFDHNGSVFWSESITQENYTPRLFSIRVSKISNSLFVVLDGVRHSIDAGLDFEFDVFQNLELFVNSGQVVADSRDAAFLRSPYVRITDLGLWSD
jgi:hypothetical protein